MSSVLRVVRVVLPADGHAIWRLDRGGAWLMADSEGLTASTFSPEHATHEAEGIHSTLVIPLTIGGVASAVIVAYARRPTAFGDTDVETAAAVGSITSAALTTAELYDEQRRTREHAGFLAQASAALAGSLDLDTTLHTVAELSVPGIADSCAIHLLDETGAVRLVAAVHVDPLKAAAMSTLADPGDSASSRIWQRTIRDGQSEMLSDITKELVVQALHGDQALLRAFDEVGFTSQISVPLRVRGRTIGGLTFMLGPGERRYEAADLALAEDLAHRAALAVDNARAYRAASEANRLKDQFLGTLSHELRTPLNAIRGYAQMLRTGVFENSAKQARALEVLERNAQTLGQIVEDVLDVSRITAGKLRLNLQSVDLAAVVRDALATILPTAEARHVRVEMRVESAVPPVIGDPERLQQVIWNLLANAVKFTADGGEVRLQLTRVDTRAEIVIADTGRGIAADFLPHLFERFRQADSRFSREHGGLGLGLAIAREIVEVHGGTIRAASEGVGKGATFTVSLPLTGAGMAVPDERSA